MELYIAREIGKEFIKLLKPACRRIKIAGSIRRKKTLVKDIEIVCEALPKLQKNLNYIINKLKNENRVKIIKNGQRYKQLSLLDPKKDEIIKLDLFVVLPPAEWGVIYLLRTGSGTFSKRFVTKIKPKFRINAGHLEELKTISDLLGKRQVYIPVKTPTEKSVFKTVGWNYFPPEERIE